MKWRVAVTVPILFSVASCSSESSDMSFGTVVTAPRQTPENPSVTQSAPAVTSRVTTPSCPKNPESLTTEIGSEEVRLELDRLANEIACQLETLRTEFSDWKQDQEDYAAAVNLENARNRNIFARCLKDNGLTESTFYEMDPFGEVTPCQNEWLDSSPELPRVEAFPKSGDLRALHDNWLRLGVALGDLASIYPDSVKPAALTTFLELARVARSCLDQAMWCFYP